MDTWTELILTQMITRHHKGTPILKARQNKVAVETKITVLLL